ncbi:hypothetical protein [Acinetobacter pittii]|uniref:hypothetical protein n=1 Tax=Acinetobacter pittii TaxID=48296 RepID=UPI002A069115|nr:hypothetical protein [Acinetobacter pittii]MDX8255247.1 hypothetical protein [Acinetobacter pittii]
MIKTDKKNSIFNFLKKYRVSILFSIFLILLFILWYFFPYIVSRFDYYKSPIQIPFKNDFDTFIERDDSNSYAQKTGAKYGTYGDSYGALNTLFSGLAFASLVLSLYLQRKELQAQRIDIDKQQQEIEKSNVIAEHQRQIADQQAKLLKQQVEEAQVRNFYDLFFKYIETKEKKVKELYFETETKRFQGSKCFGPYSALFKQNCELFYPHETIEEDAYLSKRMELTLILSQKFYDFDYAMGLPFKKSMYFDYIAFLINFIELNSEIINPQEIIKVLFSYFNEDEIFCLFWVGTRNPTIYDFLQKYQIQLFVDADVSYSVIDTLYYIYGFKEFLAYGILYKHLK